MKKPSQSAKPALGLSRQPHEGTTYSGDAGPLATARGVAPDILAAVPPTDIGPEAELYAEWPQDNPCATSAAPSSS